MGKTKRGNLTAPQMMIDLMKPRQGGVTVQQAVVVNPDPEAFEEDD